MIAKFSRSFYLGAVYRCRRLARYVLHLLRHDHLKKKSKQDAVISILCS